MIATVSSSPFIPLHESVKFVAAAYAVVLVIILAYVAIMAVRAQRIERDLDQLRRDVEAARARDEGPVRPADRASGDTGDAGAPERSGSLL